MGQGSHVGYGSRVDLHEMCSQMMDIVAIIPRKPMYLSLLDGCESLHRKRASNTDSDFTRKTQKHPAKKIYVTEIHPFEGLEQTLIPQRLLINCCHKQRPV